MRRFSLPSNMFPSKYPQRRFSLAIVSLILAAAIGINEAFTTSPSSTTAAVSTRRPSWSTSSSSSSRRFLSSPSGDAPAPSTVATTTATPTTTENKDDDEELVLIPGRKPSVDWELDCYSRPVVGAGGKKLWEVLLTDATGSFRYCKRLPSNQVNSKELRKTVEELMEDTRVETKPSTIRFFRGAMFNMINIALSDLDVVGRPSRRTYAIAQWLEERHRDVYPKMEGYKATMATGLGGGGPSFLDVRTPVKMPDALRGEKYAFVSLPLAEFKEGGSITDENIGVGRLCPIDPTLPADAFVQGVVILSQRSDALAAWLAGTEVAAMTCDLRKRKLLMETNIDTQFLMAKLNDEQRIEGGAFQEGKAALNGLHFVCVQRDEDDDPAGFWLMRELPQGI